MLRYVALRYVALRYVALCYVMLCDVMLCYDMRRYVMLYYVALCYVILCNVMICMLCHIISSYVTSRFQKRIIWNNEIPEKLLVFFVMNQINI